MTRYATPQRALHDRKARAVLLCLFLLGGVFTIIYIGSSRITNPNPAATGLSFTQPDAPATDSYYLGQSPTATSSDQPNRTQPITTTECTGGAYISAYGDTVCASEASSTKTGETATQCSDGTRSSQYGDTVCKPIP